jgi:hypothetical protein
MTTGSNNTNPPENTPNISDVMSKIEQLAYESTVLV